LHTLSQAKHTQPKSPSNKNSADFPASETATQTALEGSQNGFLTELNPAGSVEVLSPLLGGSGEVAAEVSLLGAGIPSHPTFP
jgi:hypothetical protein